MVRQPFHVRAVVARAAGRALTSEGEGGKREQGDDGERGLCSDFPGICGAEGAGGYPRQIAQAGAGGADDAAGLADVDLLSLLRGSATASRASAFGGADGPVQIDVLHGSQ